MGKNRIGTYESIPVIRTSREEFYRDYNKNEEIYYLIGKDLCRVSADGRELIAFARVDSDGYIQGYRYPSAFMEIKPPENKMAHKHSEKDCPVRVDTEYHIEEVNIEDLGALSKKIDDFLTAAIKRDFYKEIVFKGE